MIKFQDVTYRYHYDKFDLFRDLSFELTSDCNTVLCDIQSGKTTLCKLILGEIAPQSGSVSVTAVQNSISMLYLPQKPVFFEGKTVLYNLLYPTKVRKQVLPQAQVDSLANQFGLTELLKTKVKKLDTSAKRRLALARGLTVKRDIVLFDGFFDDTSADGELSVENVLALFPNAQKVVFTVHPSLAQGHTAVLDGGQCVFAGQSQEALQVVKNLGWLAEKLQ